MRPNSRYVVERLLPKPPAGSARTIKRVFVKIGRASRLSVAERIAINARIDGDGLVRIREVA